MSESLLVLLHATAFWTFVVARSRLARPIVLALVKRKAQKRLGSYTDHE